MIIKFKKEFLKNFQIIIDFIGKDSPNRALKFHNELLGKIENIVHFPYSFRKNLIIDNENVRDLIFRGYVVIFRIKNKKFKS